MSDDPEWFAPKRFGLGSGRPISWQGWALTIAFVAIAIGTSAEFRGKPQVLLAIIVPVTLTFMIICARTTRGGWRWRWNGKDRG